LHTHYIGRQPRGNIRKNPDKLLVTLRLTSICAFPPANKRVKRLRQSRDLTVISLLRRLVCIPGRGLYRPTSVKTQKRLTPFATHGRGLAAHTPASLQATRPWNNQPETCPRQDTLSTKSDHEIGQQLLTTANHRVRQRGNINRGLFSRLPKPMDSCRFQKLHHGRPEIPVCSFPINIYPHSCPYSGSPLPSQGDLFTIPGTWSHPIRTSPGSAEFLRIPHWSVCPGAK